MSIHTNIHTRRYHLWRPRTFMSKSHQCTAVWHGILNQKWTEILVSEKWVCLDYGSKLLNPWKVRVKCCSYPRKARVSPIMNQMWPRPGNNFQWDGWGSKVTEQPEKAEFQWKQRRGILRWKWTKPETHRTGDQSNIWSVLGYFQTIKQTEWGLEDDCKVEMDQTWNS